jgi:hypothetical protein
MGTLSDELRQKGFVPTGEESPIDEGAGIWTNGKEKICASTGAVIDGNHHAPAERAGHETNNGERVYRYHGSGRVRLPGGYVGSYDWGDNGDRFKY